MLNGDRSVKNIFHDMIGRFGEHAVAAGKEVYIQPYVYLSIHLVQMRAAGWHDIDFDQIAAVSGASAIFGYQPGEFMAKYAHLHVDPDQRIADATGFGCEWVNRVKGWNSARFGRHTQRVDPKPPDVIALRVMGDLVAWSDKPPQKIIEQWPSQTCSLPT